MADSKEYQAQDGKNKRFSIYLTEDMARRIDDYRYSRRIPAHSQAICELIEVGLRVFEENKASAFFLGMNGQFTIPDEPTERDLIVARVVNSLNPDVLRALEAFLQVAITAGVQNPDSRETES